uniref:Uncharacterized protein n=1 Tax=Arundo donax TaxID=35708 RepID=A0A0A8Z9J3_ARUDO
MPPYFLKRTDRRSTFFLKEHHIPLNLVLSQIAVHQTLNKIWERVYPHLSYMFRFYT